MARSRKLIPMDGLGTARGIVYSRSQLYRLIRAGKFPKPIRLGENRVAFCEHEIDAWIELKIAERDAALDGGAA